MASSGHNAGSQCNVSVDPAKVIVVLPAFNEERNLPPLLSRIHRSCSEAGLRLHMVVVDDGSTDRTWDAIEGYRDLAPLTAIRHARNEGLGPTLADGLRAAEKISTENDVIFTMDSDETHPPGLIPRMLSRIREGHDVVIASRYREGSRVFGLSVARRTLSFLASIIGRILFPIPGVRDYTCGYRAYSASSLHVAYGAYGQNLVDQPGFQCTIDILLKMRRLPLIFGEVPLILRYDLKRGASKLRPMNTALATLKLLLRHCFTRRAPMLRSTKSGHVQTSRSAVGGYQVR